MLVVPLVACLVIALLALWWMFGPDGLVSVTSRLDGRVYRVRNDSLRWEAADRLATVRQKLQSMVNFLEASPTYRDDLRVQTLLDRWPRVEIRETHVGSRDAAISLNKGSIALCLGRSNGGLGDLNTTMYVSIHEMAHLATPGYHGHDAEFWATMRLLLKVAIEDTHVYNYVMYESSPTTYCGHDISQSPFTCYTQGKCKI